MINFLAGLQFYNDWGLLALRLVIAAIFLVHGTSKLKTWKTSVSAEMPRGMLTLMRILSIVEPLGALAMATGFFVQIAAVALMIVMAGAMYFKIFKWNRKFTGPDSWELDLLLFAANLLILLSGAGRFSLEWMYFGLFGY